MEYFKKIEKEPNNDLAWNLPEKKQGTVNVVGGCAQNFKTEIKISEFLSQNFPIETVNTVLPDSLKNHLPSLPNFVFLKSTETGSFGDEEGLKKAFASADFNLLIGDFSKNSITGKIVSSACQNSEKPLLITRDSLDLIAEYNPERILMNQNMILFASMAQLQKLLRAVYYPKMLLLTQSLVQVTEVLHKFTLSYPAKIVTLYNGQFLVAENGEVVAIPLEKSGYSPLTAWFGELAVKIAIFNLFNPNNFLDATASAIFS